MPTFCRKMHRCAWTVPSSLLRGEDFSSKHLQLMAIRDRTRPRATTNISDVFYAIHRLHYTPPTFGAPGDPSFPLFLLSPNPAIERPTPCPLPELSFRFSCPTAGLSFQPTAGPLPFSPPSDRPTFGSIFSAHLRASLFQPTLGPIFFCPPPGPLFCPPAGPLFFCPPAGLLSILLFCPPAGPLFLCPPAGLL